jgi:predicted transcriptional regulator
MKTKTISKLEQEVMDIVWMKNECTVRCILAELQKKRPIAYTTVLTVLQRLHEKNLLNKTDNCKTCTFTPKISKKSYSKTIAKGFLKNFVQTFGDTGVVSLAESIHALPQKQKQNFVEVVNKTQ